MGSQTQSPDGNHAGHKGLEESGIGLGEGILKDDKNKSQAVGEVGDPVAAV